MELVPGHLSLTAGSEWQALVKPARVWVRQFPKGGIARVVTVWAKYDGGNP